MRSAGRLLLVFLLALGSVVAVAAIVTIVLSPPPVSDCPDPTLPCAPPIAEQPLSTAVAGPVETPRSFAVTAPPTLGAAGTAPSATGSATPEPSALPTPEHTPPLTTRPTAAPTATATTAPTAVSTPQPTPEPTAPTPEPTGPPTPAPTAASAPPVPPPSIPPRRPTLPSLAPLVLPTPRPPSSAALAASGAVWRSAELGVSAEFDPTFWTVQSATDRELVMTTPRGTVTLVIRVRPATETSPAQLLAEHEAQAEELLIGFTPESDARFLPPGTPVIGYRTGIGGTYAGTLDTPQGPSVPVRVGIMAAGDGQVSVCIAIVAPSSVRRDAFRLADSVANTFRWPDDG